MERPNKKKKKEEAAASAKKPREPKAKRELKKVAEAPGQQTLNSFVLTGGNSSGGGDSTIPSGTENVQRNEQQPPSVATQAVAEEETRSRNDPGSAVQDNNSKPEVFGNLGPFVDRRLRESGFEHGLAGFLRTLRRLSSEHHSNILSAREASAEYFLDHENSSSEDLRKLYAIWDYCRLLPSSSDTMKPEDMDARRIKLGEVVLSDKDLETYLPIEVALLALLSCSLDGGLEEMFKVFVALYSENNSRSLAECVDALIPDEARHLWKWDTWQEECVPIPDEFAGTIIPNNGVQMLQYTSEGLAMSCEKVVCALLYFNAITYSLDAGGWGVLFCSHVLIRSKAEGRRYILAEDFFFNRLPLGYNDRMLYATAEGRCITNTGSATFLTPSNSKGMLGVRFAADGSEKRCNSLWHVTGMAKYNLPVGEFECLLSEGGISMDHLSINHAYNQPSLVQLATLAQQAANKRPRDRETFRLETVTDAPLFIPFDELEQAQKDIALACKEKQEEGLAMARLEGGSVPREIYRRFKEAEEEELWVDLEASDSEVFFEVQKCIWRPDGDTWLLLDQPLKTTRQYDYRHMSVGGIMCYLHSAISFTKLYHQVMNSGSAVIEEANSLGEVARPAVSTDGVQVKMLWKVNGCVRQLVTDHIDQDKGNNDPANLRLLCNRTNTVAANGAPVMMLVHPHEEEEHEDGGSEHGILIDEKCAVDAVEPLLKAMQNLGYPEEYQRYSIESFLQWIYSRGARLPKCLKSKIEFISMADSDSDDENEEEEEEEEGHLSKVWFGFRYKDYLSGECFEDLIIGRLSLAKMLKTSFGVQMTVGQIYDSLDNSVLVPNDEEKRRRCIALEIGRKQSPGQRYGILDMYRLFESVLSNNVFEVTVETRKCLCRGLYQVVSWLEQDERLMARLQSHVPQGGAPTSKWIYGLVRSYFRNEAGSSLLHQEGICITRKTPQKIVVVKSEKYSMLFDNNRDKRVHLNARQVNKMLLDQGIGVFRIGTVRTWLSEAHGSTGIHKNLKLLGICDIQQPVATATEGDNDDDDDGTKKVNRPILRYTPKTGGVSVPSEKSFRSVQAAVHFAFKNLGFRLKYTKVSSLKMDLIANNEPLQSDSYMDVTLVYQKTTRPAAFCSLYVIVSTSHDFVLPQAGRLAKSVSYTLPDFVVDNVDFVDGNLLKNGSESITTVSQIQDSLVKKEYACLGFVGYSGDQKSFAGYLTACGVSDADRKIERMQKQALYYQSPLGLDVPWCCHVFTQALLENAMKRAMESKGNIAFRARAYLLKHSRKFSREEERVDLENDLNRFLLHKLKGGEAVPGLQVVKEGSGDWMDLTYPPNESGNPKDKPRNLMIGEMMSKLGLEPFSRPRKKTGFHSRTVMKSRMYFDDQCDVEEIPFLYRYMPEKKQYFLLVAIKK